MSQMTKRARWAVPAGVGAVIAAVIAGPSLIASASAGLPELTAEQLLTKVAEAEPVALSGTAVYTARLGLPELPLEAQGPAGPANLLGGSSTIRVWTDGEDQERASITGTMSEYSVVRSGAQAWTYSSQDNEAVHYTLSPEDQATYDQLHESGAQVPTGKDVPTPQEAADQFLAETKGYTDYSVDSATKVAGRDAYQLGLVPTTDGTLVDRVLIAVDAKTFTPLRVQVWSNQDTKTPALEVAFTDVSFTAPAASTFDFTAPQGATTKEVQVPLPDPTQHTEDTGTTSGDVQGTGWETIVIVSGVDTAALLADPAAAIADQATTGATDSASEQLMGEFMDAKGEAMHGFSIDAASILGELLAPVEGGQAISSALASVYITDDGRVLVGAVPVETLIAAAG